MKELSTEDFASFDLDDTDKRLEPAADAIRNTIRHQHNVGQEETIIIYGVDAWVPDKKFTAHVYIEDKNGNNVTDEYDFSKQYRSLDEMEKPSEETIDSLREWHNQNP